MNNLGKRGAGVRRDTAVRGLRTLALFAFSSAVIFAVLNLITGPTHAQTVAAGGGDLQCPVLWVDNPNPGDLLTPGGYIVSGGAYDPAAPQRLSVARVDFFLGARDAGGVFLGSLSPGHNHTGSAAQFSGEITIPRVAWTSAGADFVAYAYDASTTRQTVVVVPVHVGGQPTPTPDTFGPPPTPLTTRVSSDCVSSPTQLTSPTPQAALVAATPTPGPQLAGPLQLGMTGPLADQGGPIFELSNPTPGGLLPVGGYIVSGTAYDPASTQGPGVDRVQFFLDPRDEGGILLGTAFPQASVSGRAPTFSAKIVIPNGVQKGSHIFTAYAHSSVIGVETIISMPLFAGAVPTGTPRPDLKSTTD